MTVVLSQRSENLRFALIRFDFCLQPIFKKKIPIAFYSIKSKMNLVECVYFMK